MKTLYKIIAVIFILPNLAIAETFDAQVTSIHDGDTVTVLLGNGKPSRVRLLGVDSPEVSFKNYSQGDVALIARDFLISILPIGSRITIVTAEEVSDKHDRLLGVIYLDGVDINSEMLRNGWSVFYMIAPYSKTLAKNYSVFAKEAFLNQVGVFSKQYSKTMIPYQFRLKVSGHKGNNLVGDMETRKLYSPEDIEAVPVYNRIFFPSEEMALQRGYKW